MINILAYISNTTKFFVAFASCVLIWKFIRRKSLNSGYSKADINRKWQSLGMALLLLFLGLANGIYEYQVSTEGFHSQVFLSYGKVQHLELSGEKKLKLTLELFDHTVLKVKDSSDSVSKVVEGKAYAWNCCLDYDRTVYVAHESDLTKVEEENDKKSIKLIQYYEHLQMWLLFLGFFLSILLYGAIVLIYDRKENKRHRRRQIKRVWETTTMFTRRLGREILDGKLEYYDGWLYGRYHGFYVTMCPYSGEEAGSFEVEINAVSVNDSGNQQLERSLSEYVNHEKCIQMLFVGSSVIHFELDTDALPHRKPGDITNLLNKVMGYLEENGYISGCSECGNHTETIGYYKVGHSYCFICRRCAEKYRRKNGRRKGRKGENTVKNTLSSNLARGIAGALGGAAILGAFWIALGRFTDLAGLAGLFMYGATAGGYYLCGTHWDEKGRVCSMLIALMMIFVTNRISVTWSVYELLKSTANSTGIGTLFFHLEQYLASFPKWSSRYYSSWIMDSVLLLLFVGGELLFFRLWVKGMDKVRRIK